MFDSKKSTTKSSPTPKPRPVEAHASPETVGSSFRLFTNLPLMAGDVERRPAPNFGEAASSSCDEPTPPPGLPAGGILQRKCACAMTGGRCEECEKNGLPLQRKTAEAEAADTISGQENFSPEGQAAAAGLGAGQPLDPTTSAYFKLRFGHNFDGVRIHTGEAATQSSRSLKALAYTVGQHVVFREGLYSPNTQEGTKLLAHELAHVVQQDSGLVTQDNAVRAESAYEHEADRAAERVVAGQTAGPLTAAEPSRPQRQPAPTNFIADDAASELQPGQMRKSEFLTELRDSTCRAADEVLAGTGQATEGCPYIECLFADYSNRSSEQLNRMLRLYAPETGNAATAQEAIVIITERVRRAVETWASTGRLPDVPAGAEQEISFECLGRSVIGMAAGAVTTAVSTVTSAVSGAASGIAEGVSSVVSGAGESLSNLGSMFFKAREGGAHSHSPAVDPHAVRSQLDGGRTLDSNVSTRMGSAFGHNFSNVRIHTDMRAAALSDNLNARAFTIDDHIAFGRGEYQPGTLAGDALIAHELAHTIQQSGQTETAARNSSDTSAFEEEADLSAVAAVGSLFGLRQRFSPRRRGGLALQSCKNNSKQATPSTTTAPANTPTTTPAVPRTETQPYGTYEIVPDNFAGPRSANQLTQAEFNRLNTAWTKVNDGSGGMIINGSAADKASLLAIFAREMGRSVTFRNLIIEITEDTARPVTINVGRENAYWVDEFGSWNVDLNDMEWYEDIPPAEYPWVRVIGESAIHWLAERRYAAIHGAGYQESHEYALGAGGPQEHYRTDLGQPGRFTTMSSAQTAPGLRVGTHTDTAGNRMIFRRDSSAGDPITYEVEYAPAAPTATAPGRVRRNNMVANVSAATAAAGGGAAGTTQIYVKFISATTNVQTAEQAVATGASREFTQPLGSIVPVNGPITVEVYKKEATPPDTLLVSVPWPHPFTPTNNRATVGGIRFEAAVSLRKT